MASPSSYPTEVEEDSFGADSGWVEARTSCDHLHTLSSDLSHIPPPGTPCTRFVNKHMSNHRQESGHCLALSYSDLSVWCFSCDAYLDAEVITQLRPVHETAYLLKFGERPPNSKFVASGNLPINQEVSEGMRKFSMLQMLTALFFAIGALYPAVD